MYAATILIPTHDHGDLLHRSVQSALNQTVPEVDIVVIGDGITEEGRTAAAEIARRERRVRFVDRPKGPRHGEETRHEVLAGANSRIVCYLADDDLFLPHHVATMLKLLDHADFGHTLPLYIDPGGEIGVWTVDLALDSYRGLMMMGRNRIPLTAAGHTLEAYRRLDHGWRTTPAGVPTDLYMWQQFLSTPGTRFSSGTAPTMLHFPSPERARWTREKRLAELDAWSAKIGSRSWLAEFTSDVLATVARDRARSLGDAEFWPVARLRRFSGGSSSLQPFSGGAASGGSILGFYDPRVGMFEVAQPEVLRIQYGPPGLGWIAVCGDWDGDGQFSIGLYDPTDATFHLRNDLTPGLADCTLSYGPRGKKWLPVVGDWTGAGRTSIGLYDPHESVFHLRHSLEARSESSSFGFGEGGAGLLPVAGDWDGDGTDGVGLYSQASGNFMLTDAREPGPAHAIVQFGPLGLRWHPVSGDWNGLGFDDVGLFAPRHATYLLRSSDRKPVTAKLTR